MKQTSRSDMFCLITKSRYKLTIVGGEDVLLVVPWVVGRRFFFVEDK